MVKIIVSQIFLFLILSTVLIAQSNEEIEQQNQALQNLRSEITSLQKKLNELSTKEKRSLQALQNINQQNVLLSQLISKLRKEERQKELEINRLTSEISSLEEEMEKLREDYSRYVVWLYKNRKGSFLKFLLNAESINQALIRYKYLNYITDEKEEILTQLKNKKEQLENLITKRENERKEKERLVVEKQQEQESLEEKISEREAIIAELKTDQNSLIKEIEEKRIAETQIKNLIAKLIEEERARQEAIRLARMNNEKVKYDYSYDDFENFASLEGVLNWPVKSGRIIRNFGENRNEKLNTVTLNYGVDIGTAKGEPVNAVAEGIISAIEWIPGYGSVIIITHKNNFRTVYGHLSEISVNEGDQVKGGTKLGHVTESLEGNILHFEIWNERNYQNPEVWLVRK
jgi:septal ring factor EnvC (AmiA/AmiB activator)